MEAPVSWRPMPVDLPPGTRLGNWSVIGRLGWGGYGAVYLVRDVREPRRQAALKLALQSGAAARRLVREGDLLERVRHPNVVRFIEAGHWVVPGTEERLPFLVMEYVPGAQLNVWASHRDIRVGEALVLFRQALLAAHAVHEAGGVHRDIKEENLLVCEGDGRLVLVDFGVGDYEGALTLTGTLLPPGTSAYRSPEALRFQREHWSDFEARYVFLRTDELYALGVTGYRLFTRGFPFEAEGLEDSQQARLEGRRPAAPATLNPCVPQRVSELVSRLLAPRPEERPSSALEVAEEVEKLLRDGGPGLEAHLFARTEGFTPHSRVTEEVRPPSPRAPLPRWAVLTGLLLVATLVLGLVMSGLSSGSSHPPQEDTAMNESKAPTSSSPSQEPTLSALELEFFKSLAMAACLFSAGCAGVPVKSDWPQDCPPESLAAMREWGFGPGASGYITLDIDQPGAMSDRGDYRAGPIVSIFGEKDRGATRPQGRDNVLPVGTKVFGFMWTGGERIHAYWTRAELPDGQQLPVCIAMGFGEWGGWPEKEPGMQPGTFSLPKRIQFKVVRRFGRPE
jgi:eukaryotic-like serine/threonine-protein kinase